MLSVVILAGANILAGQSKGFAFAQFVGVPEARRFLDRYYPTVPLYNIYDPTQSGATEPIYIRIAFGRERDDRERAGKGEDDWKCDVVCFELWFW